MSGDKFKFPITDGTVKNSGEDQDLRTSTVIRDRPDREKNKEIFKENQTDLLQHRLVARGLVMVKQETIAGPFQGTSFTAITLNPESNCKCREKRHSQFH